MTEVLTSLCARRYGRPEGSEPGESRRPGARNDIGPAGLSQAGGSLWCRMSLQPEATQRQRTSRHDILAGALTDDADWSVMRVAVRLTVISPRRAALWSRAR